MIESNFAIALAASVAAALLTTSGIFAVRKLGEKATKNTVYFAVFAAGVLITVSFLHIVPEASSMNESAPAYLLGGFLLMLVFNRFMSAPICSRALGPSAALGLIPLIGIGFHSFLDGVVYSIGFNVSAYTGVLVALGMVLHEFPEGVVIYALLVGSGIPASRALLLSLIAAAVTTPLGTLVSYPFVSRIDQSLLGLLLAVSAGALIYVGATHLLPQAEHEHRRFVLAAFCGGVFVALGIILTHA